MVVSGDDVGKRIGYKFELPCDLIYNPNRTDIIEFIIKCLPPAIDNFQNRDYIIEKIMQYFYKLNRL